MGFLGLEVCFLNQVRLGNFSVVIPLSKVSAPSCLRPSGAPAQRAFLHSTLSRRLLTLSPVFYIPVFVFPSASLRASSAALSFSSPALPSACSALLLRSLCVIFFFQFKYCILQLYGFCLVLSCIFYLFVEVHPSSPEFGD